MNKKVRRELDKRWRIKEETRKPYHEPTARELNRRVEKIWAEKFADQERRYYETPVWEQRSPCASQLAPGSRNGRFVIYDSSQSKKMINGVNN